MVVESFAPADGAAAVAQVEQLESLLLVHIMEAWQHRAQPEWVPSEISQMISILVASVRMEQAQLIERMLELGYLIHETKIARARAVDDFYWPWLEGQQWVSFNEYPAEAQIDRIQSGVLLALDHAWRHTDHPELLRSGISEELHKLVSIVRAERSSCLSHIDRLAGELHEAVFAW